MLAALILYLFSMEVMRPGTEGGTRCRGVYISSVSCTKCALKKISESLDDFYIILVSLCASNSICVKRINKGKFREFSVGLPS